MRVLVTGGAGYIGSHTCVELLQAGFDVTVLDNFCNSDPESLRRVEELTGKKLTVVKGDIRVKEQIAAAFDAAPVDAVIHFAGLKAVGESVAKPLEYYYNNVAGTVNLCRVMAEKNVKRIVFSSSATVYGDPEQLPITEDMPSGRATNPYGSTKCMCEQILTDLQKADPEWQVVLLRYFNPVGAHASGRIGEDPVGIPNNLMPIVAQAAVGRREKVSVFGQDYATPDGTGVRDYIHVTDLARGHVCALEKMEKANGGRWVYNLGTGRGYSVLELIAAFEKASGRVIKKEMALRRPGDIDASYADPSLAQKELGWKAEKDLAQMCEDTWRWQKQNPNGYRD